MRIIELSIQNYKSLRSINISPTPLSVIVGANASGKSNFADSLDFVSEVYRHGLEVAVGRKGGYENIAFRKIRRSKKPIKVKICVEFTPRGYDWLGREKDDVAPLVKVEHSFSFVARGYSISAEFEIINEELDIYKFDSNHWSNIGSIRRTGETYDVHSTSGRLTRKSSKERITAGDMFFDLSFLDYYKDRKERFAPTELIVGPAGRMIPVISAFTQELGGLRVFQISPSKSREFGVPTPTPELSRLGDNLPAVIDMMQKRYKREWRHVILAMRTIIPGLKSIEVDYTSAKTLGLFFKEDLVGRAWSVEEVSDGTIQTLAILVAIFNPASTALVIEEPENSVHAWIVRHILDACREASKTKPIILTTHSPIVINSVTPEEVWIIWRHGGETHIGQLSQLDPGFLQMWQDGDIPTFEYIDSGALAKAIPPAPVIDLE